MTTVIDIEWLSDEHDCETCGSATAQGARVLFDGELAFEMAPRAHCFDDVSWQEWQVYHAILQRLGHDAPPPDWFAPATPS